MKLWVDDVRHPPSTDWVFVRSVRIAKQKLLTMQVTEMSLDHDMGLASPTGYDLLKWIKNTNIRPRIVKIHSENPVGRQNMAAALKDMGYVNVRGLYWTYREAEV